MKIEVTYAKNEKDLLEILKLQEENHKSSVGLDQRNEQGFVTVKHDLTLLREMNSSHPQIIAKAQGKVIGYALVMPVEFKEKIPVLKPMFEMFGQLHYLNKKLNEYSYYVMGQICVASDFRRKGIFGKLYEGHRQTFSEEFDFCITEVSSSNVPSMKAHWKTGFKTIHSFSDQTDEWNILLWNWKP